MPSLPSSRQHSRSRSRGSTFAASDTFDRDHTEESSNSSSMAIGIEGQQQQQQQQHQEIRRRSSQWWGKNQTIGDGQSPSSSQTEKRSSVHITTRRASSIDAEKVYHRELRQSRKSQYSSPTFHDDIQKAILFASTMDINDVDDYESEMEKHNNNSTIKEEHIQNNDHKQNKTSTKVIVASRSSVDNNSKKKKGVRFSTVTIHEHPRIVGDNPGGLSGPPVSIDWKAISMTLIDIDKYEMVRTADENDTTETADGRSTSTGYHHGHRREATEMRLESSHRVHILRQMGCTDAEIEAATKAANTIRTHRYRTNDSYLSFKSQERMEVMSRTLSNVMTLGMKKRKERAFLRKHVPSSSFPSSRK